MSRKLRNSFSDGFFHIMVQGTNRLYIFDTQQYKSIYLNLILEQYTNYNISLIAYCIMGNHAHMLFYVNDMYKLSSFMQKINSIYSQKYNYFEKRIGSVFRDRFKSEYIDTPKYLIKCIKYIHQNPVKANIILLENDYEFSSAKLYFENNNIIDFKILNDIFGKENFINLLSEIDYNDSPIMDIEPDQTISKCIDIYLNSHNITLDKLKSNEISLFKLIFYLYNLGYKQIQIAKEIDLHVRKISRLLKKYGSM